MENFNKLLDEIPEDLRQRERQRAICETLRGDLDLALTIFSENIVAISALDKVFRHDPRVNNERVVLMVKVMSLAAQLAHLKHSKGLAYSATVAVIKLALANALAVYEEKIDGEAAGEAAVAEIEKALSEPLQVVNMG